MDLEFREIRIYEKEDGFHVVDNSSKEEICVMSKGDFYKRGIHNSSVEKYNWKGKDILTVVLNIEYLEE